MNGRTETKDINKLDSTYFFFSLFYCQLKRHEQVTKSGLFVFLTYCISLVLLWIRLANL